MNRQLLESYEPILRRYRLQADYIEEYGKVKKIYTKTGAFALKEVDTPQQLQAITNAYRLFSGKAIPIFQSSRGAYFVSDRKRYYYLMPWLAAEKREERNERRLQFFRDLAELHRTTLKEIEVKEEELLHYYEETKKQRELQREFLQTYVEACEDEWYMSPFQLQFCTYFHETMQAYWFAQSQLEKWYEKIKETKKSRIALVHGNAALSHYVYDQKGNGYFLSFERSRFAPPLFDVLVFFRKYLRTFPVMSDECVNWFVQYQQFLPIREEELALFLSHIAEPAMIYRLVHQYANNENRLNEQKQISQLQKAYWMMKNIEYVSMRIVELEEKKKEQEESHASS